jgi:hypothetical protein
LVEQRTHKPRVPRSIRGTATILPMAYHSAVHHRFPPVTVPITIGTAMRVEDPQRVPPPPPTLQAMNVLLSPSRPHSVKIPRAWQSSLRSILTLLTDSRRHAASVPRGHSLQSNFLHRGEIRALMEMCVSAWTLGLSLRNTKADLCFSRIKQGIRSR